MVHWCCTESLEDNLLTPERMPIRAFTALLFALGCRASAPVSPTPGAALEHRPFRPTIDGQTVLAGIAYGPYRTGQHPAGPHPDRAELAEDLRLLAAHWNLLRVYGSGGPTETMLEVIRDEDLPLRVVLGAWIDPDAEADNLAEVNAAIRLAQAHPRAVVAVNVGNETQVSWSGHRSDPDRLIHHLRRVRSAVPQPVTTADDYSFWNKPESRAIAREIDFILLHAHPLWNGKTLDEAVPWTASTLAAIQAIHPTLPIVLGETGWATEHNPDGAEGPHIKASTGTAEQARFYEAFTTWAEAEQQPYLFFSAFDEPWKGSEHPHEVEKHWGLYREDRTPKPAMQRHLAH